MVLELLVAAEDDVLVAALEEPVEVPAAAELVSDPPHAVMVRARPETAAMRAPRVRRVVVTGVLLRASSRAVAPRWGCGWCSSPVRGRGGQSCVTGS
jgi:hypothetical protein